MDIDTLSIGNQTYNIIVKGNGTGFLGLDEGEIFGNNSYFFWNCG